MGASSVLIPILVYFASSVDSQFISQPDNFQVKLTAERGGPPPGALFVPITVVNIPESGTRPALRPLKGRPPPPPPILGPKPTKRPKPIPLGPIAPPPLPVPLPVDQEIPVGPDNNQIPPHPEGGLVVTPPTEIRPDLETVAPTPEPPPSTTPNTNDASPAYYQRFTLNEDGSYFFDFQSPNTIKRSEQGFVKHDPFLQTPIFVKTGMYSYTSPEGIPFRTDFIADERGYRAFQNVL